jgi:polyisoprenoid-binding protein YceI
MKNSIKFLFVVALAVCISSIAGAQDKWNLDKAHAGVKFTVTHMLISEVEGSFKTFDGSMTASKPDFTDALINFTVDVASISTDNEMRDKHLKSDDFFNAEKFPKMTFKSSSFKKVSDKKYELTGDLTIRDVTKKVKFDVTFGGTMLDPYGNTRAGFKATGTINRLDYGLKWNKLTEAGGAIVSSDVNLVISAEFTKGK